MFVTNWISTTKIQKISEITNFFRHYFLSRTEVSIQGFVCKILPEWCGDFSAKQRPDLVKIRQNRYLRNRIITDSQKSVNEILL